jgi:hypothetical protein
VLEGASFLRAEPYYGLRKANIKCKDFALYEVTGYQNYNCFVDSLNCWVDWTLETAQKDNHSRVVCSNRFKRRRLLNCQWKVKSVTRNWLNVLVWISNSLLWKSVVGSLQAAITFVYNSNCYLFEVCDAKVQKRWITFPCSRWAGRKKMPCLLQNTRISNYIKKCYVISDIQKPTRKIFR